MFITVTHSTKTNKESECKMTSVFCQQTPPKRRFANVNMTLYCDVTNSTYPLTTQYENWVEGHTTSQSPRTSSDRCTPLLWGQCFNFKKSTLCAGTFRTTQGKKTWLLFLDKKFYVLILRINKEHFTQNGIILLQTENEGSKRWK